MTENNHGNEYHANAFGGLLSYETRSYKGVHLGISRIIIYKLFSSDLNKPYTQTNKSSRWEQELWELGRDQFYSSMPRSRIEGLGGMDVIAISYQYHWNHLSFNPDATTTYGASIRKYELNKYNIDDYYQINTRQHYEFTNFF